jgi:hypothetical protein
LRFARREVNFVNGGFKFVDGRFKFVKESFKIVIKLVEVWESTKKGN